MSTFKQLNNKHWLKTKYFVEGLSMPQIATLVGAKNSNSVRQAILKFGWVPRNRREGQIFGRQDTLINDEEVINGTLLGDAHLHIFNKLSDQCAPYYVKKSKNKDYARNVGKLLVTGTPKITLYEFTLKANNRSKLYTSWVFRTLSSDTFNLYYYKWYPKSNGFKKVVPKDLKLTPRTILYWFMDDGCSHSRNRANEYKALGKNWRQRTKQIKIEFCSESFTKKENEFLAKQLKDFGLSVRVTPSAKGTGWRIQVNQSSAQDFFKLIGPCPVRSMQYKWKLDNLEK